MTHRQTHAADFSFFQGIPIEELTALLDGLERRTYAAGSVVVAEGDRTKEIYIPESGSAEVVISAPDGSEHRVGRVAPGGTVGEISVLTGQPAVATVRATSDLSVMVMGEADFARVADRFPQIYRNIGAILAERLARTDRLVTGRPEGRLTELESLGAPPLLAYALACSIAWHTRERTVLIVLDDDPPSELTSLATTSHEPPWRSGRGQEAGADLIVAPPSGPFATDSVVSTLGKLFGLFKHILIQARTGTLPRLSTSTVVRLTSHDAMPSGGPGGPLTIRGWTPASVMTRPDLEGVVSVPELGPDDEQGLRDGLLPSRSAAGRAIGWAARDLAGLKVGLALGAGSIRGYAHLGAIDVLQRKGLEFDTIAGTSVGAAVAALLAGEYTVDEIAVHLDAFSPNLFKLTVPYRGLLSDRGMRSYLRSIDPNRRFDQVPVPLALIAADVLTQQELVFREGLIWPAVLASISIPGIYPAKVMGPHVVVDGGVLNPLPVNVAADLGSGTVIGIKLGGFAPSPVHDVEVMEPKGTPPPMLPVLLRSIELMQRGIATEPTDATVVTIAPICDPTGVSLRNMQEGRRYIEDGAKAAEAALPRLAGALPWLR